MRPVAISTAACLAIASGAHASFTFTDMNTHTLAGGQSATVFSANSAGGHLVSFEYSFDYDEPVSDGSWASDIQIEVSTPDGSLTIGGYDTFPTFVPPYDGPASGAPGNYGWTVDLTGLDYGFVGPGLFTVTVTNDWFADPNPNTVSNFTGALSASLEPPTPPAPGAVGLFGIAGVAAARRRR